MILSGESSITIADGCADPSLKLEDIFTESSLLSCGNNNADDTSKHDLANSVANGDVEMEEGERHHIDIEDDDDDDDDEKDDIPPDVYYMDSDDDNDDDDDYQHETNGKDGSRNEDDDEYDLDLRNFLFWDPVVEAMPCSLKDKDDSGSSGNIEALRENSMSADHTNSSLSSENDTKNKKKGVVSAVGTRETNGKVDGNNNDDEYDAEDLRNFLFWDDSAGVVAKMSNNTPRIMEDKDDSGSKYSSSLPHENDTKNKGVSSVGKCSPRSEEQQRIKFAAANSPREVVDCLIKEVQDVAALRGIPFTTSKAAEEYIFKRYDDSIVNNLMENSVVETANDYAWDHELESEDGDKETQSDEALEWAAVDYDNNAFCRGL